VIIIEKVNCIVKKVVDIFIDHPMLDIIFVFVVSLFIYKAKPWEWDVFVISEYATFYSSILAIALGILGLGTVTTTLIVTLPQNEKLTMVYTKIGRSLFSLMFVCLFELVLVSFVLLTLFGLSESIFRSILSANCILLIFTSAVRYLLLLRKILNLMLP